MYCYILNRLGVANECDGRTGRQTERPLPIAQSNIVRRALETRRPRPETRRSAVQHNQIETGSTCRETVECV